jgi:hypothetical protein
VDDLVGQRVHQLAGDQIEFVVALELDRGIVAAIGRVGADVEPFLVVRLADGNVVQDLVQADTLLEVGRQAQCFRIERVRCRCGRLEAKSNCSVSVLLAISGLELAVILGSLLSW